MLISLTLYLLFALILRHATPHQFVLHRCIIVRLLCFGPLCRLEFGNWKRDGRKKRCGRRKEDITFWDHFIVCQATEYTEDASESNNGCRGMTLPVDGYGNDDEERKCCWINDILIFDKSHQADSFTTHWLGCVRVCWFAPTTQTTSKCRNLFSISTLRQHHHQRFQWQLYRTQFVMDECRLLRHHLLRIPFLRQQHRVAPFSYVHDTTRAPVSHEAILKFFSQAQMVLCVREEDN